MLKYIMKKIGYMIVTLFIIMTATFFLVNLIPRDPMQTGTKILPEAVVKNLEEKWGLDKPLGERYIRYLSNFMKGEFGESYTTPGLTANEVISERLPASIQLGLQAVCVGLIVGTSWTGLARLVRGQILNLKECEYVLAAKTLGTSSSKIIGKHLLPNLLSIIIVNTTFTIPGFIFSEAFLSFIGMGIQPPNTSWGAMAALGQQQMSYFPHELLFPAIAISLTMLAFNLLGDGLRDAFDPKLRQ